jgi:hypothetical protein
MSSTRRSKDQSRFHQNRYASSAEFERGLLANLVAKRSALIESPATRELIWFIQYLSHQEGGMPSLAKNLVEKFSAQIQTREMAELKLRAGTNCNVEQVKKIRAGLPAGWGEDFLLKGEIRSIDIICDSSKANHEANKRPTS